MNTVSASNGSETGSGKGRKGVRDEEREAVAEQFCLDWFQLLASLGLLHVVMQGLRTCKWMSAELLANVDCVLLPTSRAVNFEAVDIASTLVRLKGKDVMLSCSKSPEAAQGVIAAMKIAAFEGGFGEKLHHLDFWGCGIGEEGAATLSSIVGECMSLVHLGLGYNKLEDAGAAILGEGVLRKCKALRFLDLSCNFISGTGGCRLASALAGCPSLEYLNLDGNQLSDSISLLAPVVLQSSLLSQLLLRKCLVKEEGMQALSAQIGLCINLTHLDLSENKIVNAQPFQALTQALQGLSLLTRLKLQHCQLGQEALESVGVLLSACPQYQALDLSRNSLREEGLRILSPGIVANSTLTYLDLSDNALGAAAAGHVCSILSSCSRLKNFNVSRNALGPEGIEAVARLLPRCSSLSSLDLSGNAMGSAGAKAISGAMEALLGLREVDLGWNGVGDEGVRWLADVLPRCKALAWLGLVQNGIGDEGALSLTRTIGGCSALREVDLSSNRLGEEAAAELAAAVGDCTLIGDWF